MVESLSGLRTKCPVFLMIEVKSHNQKHVTNIILKTYVF